MLVTKKNIQSIIPHRDPFVMIDNLISVTDKMFATNFTVTESNIFLQNKMLREYALIENIAQSCAAGLYYLGLHNNEKLTDGFMGSVSKLQVYVLPGLHDTIQTYIYPMHRFANLYLLKGENFWNGIKLMECEIKLAGLEK